MTKLVDDASEAARHLPPVALTQEERDAIARSKAAAVRGEFATDEEVRALWSRHGL